jgi:hypothetical protein
MRSYLILDGRREGGSKRGQDCYGLSSLSSRISHAPGSAMKLAAARQHLIRDVAPLSDSLSCFDGLADNMRPEPPTSRRLIPCSM